MFVILVFTILAVAALHSGGIVAAPVSGPVEIERLIDSIPVTPIDKVQTDTVNQSAAYQMSTDDKCHRYVSAPEGRIDTNTMEEIVSDNPYAKNKWPGALIQGASLDSGD